MLGAEFAGQVPPPRAIHPIFTAPADTGPTDFQRQQAKIMLVECLSVLQVAGQTVLKIVPIPLPRRRIRGFDALVGLQSRPAMVAQARDRHRRLLLVLDPAGRPLRAHWPDGDGRCLCLQHSRRGRSDQVLRRRLRSARTFYMPKNELPDAYGIDGQSVPESIGAQLLYPFQR